MAMAHPKALKTWYTWLPQAPNTTRRDLPTPGAHRVKTFHVRFTPLEALRSAMARPDPCDP